MSGPGRSRRRFFAATAGLALSACSSRFTAPESGPFTVLLAGEADDGGFNSLVLEGVTRVEARRNVPVHVVAVPSADGAALAAALRSAARSADFTMIFAAGASFSAPVQRVAWEFPQQKFTLLQGELLRPNLAAYVLREEEPAWLAGFLAARSSGRQAVGMLSDVAEPRRARLESAFRAGALEVDGRISILQADARRGMGQAAAELAAQADVVFGALDAAPDEAIAACRAAGVKYISSLRDWTSVDAGTVIASAVADPGALYAAAVQDLTDAVWRGDFLRAFTLRYTDMLGFAMSARIPPAVADAVKSAALDVASGRVAIPGAPA